MPRFAFLLAWLIVLGAAPAAAQAAEFGEADAEVLIQTLRHNKKALVDVNLGLTDEEAAAFWPLYDRYESDLGAADAKLVEVIESYRSSFGSMTDAKAAQLVEGYLAYEKERLGVRSDFRVPISEVLPGTKVMRFYQIENKIDAVLRYELAATIPVVSQ